MGFASAVLEYYVRQLRFTHFVTEKLTLIWLSTIYGRSLNVGVFDENGSLQHWNIVADGVAGRVEASAQKRYYLKTTWVLHVQSLMKPGL